jgi:hypothetical protein
MRYIDETDSSELESIDPWKLNLLKLNPEFYSWEPDEGFAVSNEVKRFESWESFGPWGLWGLDSYNECVNFYFEVNDRSLSLVLWWLYPRKGTSKIIEVKNIQESDRPAIIAFLKQAAQRNADRFSKITAL